MFQQPAKSEIASQIQFQVESIKFHNEENGWTVLSARDSHTDLSVTVTGSFPPISPGEIYEGHGEWVSHKEFGRQFKAASIIAVKPETRGATIKFLHLALFKDIKGLGKKTAEKIVKHFGLSVLEILDESPERLREIKGLSSKHIDAIVDAWDEHSNSSEVVIFLSSKGIALGTAQKIIKFYGSETKKIIKSNPYRLAFDISGVGFKTADLIALSEGLAPDSVERFKACAVHILSEQEDNGHSYQTLTQLKSGVFEYLKLQPSAALEKTLTLGLEQLHDNEYVELYTLKGKELKTAEDPHICMNYDLFESESYIKNRIEQLMDEPFKGRDPTCAETQQRIESWLDKFCSQSGLELSEDQNRAVIEAAKSKLFVLTGGPGVGKTTTSNTIIRLLIAMGKAVCLAAPTGRAAQRMTEITGMESKTIHRLLEWNPNENSFMRNEHNPVTADVIIIDESSMIDVRLASALLAAIPLSAQVIFIGDVDQLPSVGPGSFLRDLIESGVVPFVKLDKVFRQAASSLIISSAHHINSGRPPEVNNTLNSDFRFIEAESTADILFIIKDLVQNKLPQAGWDPVHDIQILTPMNKGDIGAEALNSEIQKLLNPPSEELPKAKTKLFFREKDKVIQNVNNYELSVFNGDIGTVSHTNTSRAKAIVSFGHRKVSYGSENIKDLKLAYAITIHKSQGSEFPVVIIPCSKSHYVMLQRNLFYTGLTRAKKLAIFVGQMSAVRIAAQNTASLSRQTLLSHIL